MVVKKTFENEVERSKTASVSLGFKSVQGEQKCRF